MVPSGGARPGAGRKPSKDVTRQGSVAARLFPPDAETLKSYGDTGKVLSLLAGGLRLGEGNLPELTDGERQCLQEVLSIMLVDALTLRFLPDEIEGSEHPDRGSLLHKLRGAGDWELLALVLRHYPVKALRINYGGL